MREEAEEWQREASEAAEQRDALASKAFFRMTPANGATPLRSSVARLGPRGSGSLLGQPNLDPPLPPQGSASPRHHGIGHDPPAAANGAQHGDREKLGGVDMVYLKNVLLRFVMAHLRGRTQERDVLLPAVATLLRASPQEFHALKSAVDSGGAASWWPRLV